MRVLLITPPLTQPNAPYPATTVLAGFLESRGIRVAQEDASLDLILRVFSRDGVRAMTRAMRPARKKVGRGVLAEPLGERRGSAGGFAPPVGDGVGRFLADARRHAETVDAVVRFLQGRNPALARRIAGRRFLPEGPRFRVLDTLGLDGLAVTARARYFASLYMDDLADLIREHVDPHFELSRYAERIAASAPSFEPIRRDLEKRKPTLVDGLMDRLALDALRKHRPDVVGLTVPFPGNVYGAFRIARAIKRRSPRTKVVLGGGYVSTELRELSDPRVFDYADYVVLDDGEIPLLRIVEGDPSRFVRTLWRERGRVVDAFSRTRPHRRGLETASTSNVPHCQKPSPSFRGLRMDRYLPLCEMLNPMYRLWSDTRWNKLMLAHGCYWRKCAFCDTSLDYIRRFEPAPADVLVDRIEAVMRQTGERGFHFTDEAAPPALLRSLSKGLIERKVGIEWWCNIRLEKPFTPELARLMAKAGCIAVTGGLETASDRTLKLMQKGVTVAQAARVAKAFAGAGIMVHAYLMYGFPTQTEAEILEGLENVRRLFAEGWIQSAYWHRFALTAHSPIARDPGRFGIRLLQMPRATFARNEILYEDVVAAASGRRSATGGRRYSDFGPGLRKAVYNFMHGAGMDRDVRSWFDFDVTNAFARGGIPKSRARGRMPRRESGCH